MELTNLPYQTTNRYSKLLIDYVNEDKKLNPFVNHFPSLSNFKKQITEKKNHTIDRGVLVKVLKEQNFNFPLSVASNSNINLLTSGPEAAALGDAIGQLVADKFGEEC